MTRSGLNSSTARMTSSNCVMSPRTTGAPIGAPSKGTAAGFRSIPTTDSPRAISLRMRRGPMNPVAPSTSTDMGVSLSCRADRSTGLRVHSGPMTTRTPHVYVIPGRGQRDYGDCQAALERVPARMTTLGVISTEDEVIAKARDADGLVIAFAPITRAVMSALEGLKTVVRTGVGYDVIDVPAATELGVIVVNIPDIWVREVANHALGLLLAWNRKIVTLDRQVHAGTWSSGVPGGAGSLHGETVGVVGLGNIGSAFARRVAAFETKVIACDPYVDDRRFKELGVERVTLEALAERADYVSVHTLLNGETRHLIGEAFFRRTKPTAILINTSRGPVVDEEALARALQDKRLAGAALDVWETEPLAADNPLLKMDNVIATPHAAYFSSAAVAQVPRRCGEEVARVLTGQRPLNVVNPEIYSPGAARRARP